METPEVPSLLTFSLLLLPLAIVLAIGAIFAALVRSHVRRNRVHGPNDLERLASVKSNLGLGWRMPNPESAGRWCAIHGASIRAVERALGLQNLRPCAWDQRLERSSGNSLFVSPTIRDWVLVVGDGLPDPAEDVDRCFHFVRELSQTLGRVQFFSFNRVVGHHAWVWMDDGAVRRAYAWAGETLWNQGRITREERDLGLVCHGYGWAADASNGLLAGLSDDNVDKLHCLAAKWSVDPASIQNELMVSGPGVVGDLAQSRWH